MHTRSWWWIGLGLIVLACGTPAPTLDAGAGGGDGGGVSGAGGSGGTGGGSAGGGGGGGTGGGSAGSGGGTGGGSVGGGDGGDDGGLDASVPDAGAPFNAVCATDDACASRLCVQTLDGLRCSAGCDSTAPCAAGWRCGALDGGASYCWPRFERLCAPCTADGDCAYLHQGAGTADDSRCLPAALDGGDDLGLFCATGCTGAGDCPSGYTCTGGSCVKSSGSCDCDPRWAGQAFSTACANTVAGIGRCTGFRFCPADGGALTACSAVTPAAESCNGVDDDCDGTVDNSGAALCTQDAGACFTYTCGGAAGCGAMQQLNTCVIDGTCYSNGQASSANNCLECDSAQSQTTFTNSPTTRQCASADACHAAGFCSGGGTCTRPLLQDFFEPNENHTTAWNLGDHTDCDADARSVAARLSGPGDSDWFRSTVIDEPFCTFAGSASVISAGEEVRLCVWHRCLDSTQNPITCAAGSTGDTSLSLAGYAGCCKSGINPSFTFEPSCVQPPFGSDKSGDVRVRVDQLSSAAVCASYSLSYTF